MSVYTRQIGKNIRILRHREGLTQEILAEKADLSVNFVSAIERGTARPTIDTLGKIALSLNARFSDLFIDGETSLQPEEALNELKRLLKKNKNIDAPLLLSLYRTIHDQAKK